MSEYRMLVVDLDGTALCEDGSLRTDDRDAALALRAAGVELSIATGRLWGGTAWVAKALGITGSVAVMNGSARVDVGSGEVGSRTELDADVAEDLRTQARKRALPAFLFESSSIRHHPEDSHHTSYLRIWTEDLRAEEYFYERSFWNREDLLAVGLIGDHAAVDALEEYAIARDWVNTEIKAFDTFTGARFLSVRRGCEDKGTALERLAADRGLGTDSVVVVGDWWNDVPMLRRAGHSFAMGGSTVEEEATDVLVSRRGEGGAIAEIARRIWNIV